MRAMAQALDEPLRMGIFDEDNLGAIYRREVLAPGAQSNYPLDFVRPGTEDLDFTMAKESDIKKIISNLRRDFGNLGINTRISDLEEKDKSLSFKISAEGPLFTKEIDRCFVSVEISKREEVFNYMATELKTNYREILGFSAIVMAEKEILAEKIRALLTRNQARDLYDIYFLLKKGTKIDIGLINRKLEYYGRKAGIKEIVSSIKNKKEIWLPELNSFVIGEIPDFRIVEKYTASKIKQRLSRKE